MTLPNFERKNRHFFIFMHPKMDKNNLQEELLKLIKDTREAKGLSRRKLADLAGISPTSYNDYESGENPIPFDRLLKILHVLELDIFNFGKTVEIEQTSLQLVPVDGKQIENYFQATMEAFQMMQEKAKEDNKEIKDLKKDIEEIKELLRNKA